MKGLGVAGGKPECQTETVDGGAKEGEIGECGEGEGEDRTLKDIVAWLVINSMRSEQVQWAMLCLQNVSNIYRKTAFECMLRAHQRLGKGAYGIVWRALDNRTKKVVALKKIFDAFQNATDAQRTFREIMFLQELDEHEHIIRLHNVMKADNDRDIYLVFEHMETDLHAAIRANILGDVHKQYIMYQSFKALKYIHSAHVRHRDLKPSNVLLDSSMRAKICDFGLARFHLRDGTSMTGAIGTPAYMAPEPRRRGSRGASSALRLTSFATAAHRPEAVVGNLSAPVPVQIQPFQRLPVKIESL